MKNLGSQGTILGPKVRLKKQTKGLNFIKGLIGFQLGRRDLLITDKMNSKLLTI